MSKEGFQKIDSSKIWDADGRRGSNDIRAAVTVWLASVSFNCFTQMFFGCRSADISKRQARANECQSKLKFMPPPQCCCHSKLARKLQYAYTWSPFAQSLDLCIFQTN